MWVAFWAIHRLPDTDLPALPKAAIWSEQGFLLLGRPEAALFRCEDGDSNHHFGKSIVGRHPGNLRASAVRHLHAAPRHIPAYILPRFPLRDASLIMKDSPMGAGSPVQIATSPKLH